ncbi:hypothetical protein [Mangrovicella endophytica]|uniref:hypothetical protein n=1 Tax=Mangrovicella endophytica TaxID=2066697 RepID=UPI001FE22B24|nr:hypothetical protein [Mangrovicella endophytica]
MADILQLPCSSGHEERRCRKLSFCLEPVFAERVSLRVPNKDKRIVGMKRSSILLAGSAFLSISAAPALADCNADLQAMSADTTTTSSTDAGGAAASGGTTTQYDASGKETKTDASGQQIATSSSVSKDGSTAPLQETAGATAGNTAGTGTASGTTAGSGAGTATASASGGTTTEGGTTSGGAVSKDGSTMPLANAEGGGDVNVATSSQDAQAQQSGQMTAAAAQKPEVMAALDKARTALSSGDEAACQAALQEAKRLSSGS